MVACRVLSVWGLLIGLAHGAVGAGRDDVDPDELVARIEHAVVRGAADVLESCLEDLKRLDVSEARVHRVHYWTGYVHWRLAEIDGRGAGLHVGRHYQAAGDALERCVALVSNDAEAHGLLGWMYAGQLYDHYEQKAKYVQKIVQAGMQAMRHGMTNPRVALTRGFNLVETPAEYGGGAQSAVDQLKAAYRVLETEPSTFDTPRWGRLDAWCHQGRILLDHLGDPVEAEAAYRAALALEAECVEARDHGLPRAMEMQKLLVVDAAPAVRLPDPDLSGRNLEAGWTGWRGPRGDNVSDEDDWADEGTERWRLELGVGDAGVVVQDGRLVTSGYDQAAQEDAVVCLDAESGDVLWSRRQAAALWNELHAGGTLTSPVLNDGSVFVLNREGKMARLAFEDGAEQWARDLAVEESLKPSRWGFAGTPLVLDQQLILNVGRIMSLNKADGATQWRTEYYGDTYSTPTHFVRNERHLLAVFTAPGLVIVALNNGEEVAQYPWTTKYDQNSASPLVDEDGRIFITSGMNVGCALLELTESGLKPVWESKAMRCLMTGCVRREEYLFGFDDKQFACIDLNGDTQWSERGFGWGSLSRAGDRLLVLDEDGAFRVIEATEESFVERSRVDVFDDGECWTSPVLVDGLIYLRNNLGTLVCRDHRGVADE